MALGSVGAAIPFSVYSLLVFYLRGRSWSPMSPKEMIVLLALVWGLIAAVYVACALPLRPSRRDGDEKS